MDYKLSGYRLPLEQHMYKVGLAITESSSKAKIEPYS